MISPFLSVEGVQLSPPGPHLSLFGMFWGLNWGVWMLNDLIHRFIELNIQLFQEPFMLFLIFLLMVGRMLLIYLLRHV